MVEARETSAFFVWLDALHFDDLGPRQNIGELDWAPGFLLVLDDLLYRLLDRVALGDGLVESVALVGVLVSDCSKSGEGRERHLRMTRLSVLGW